MSFDQYYVEIDGGKFRRGAQLVANETEESLPYVMLGAETSLELLWGRLVKNRDQRSSIELPWEGPAAPFYIVSAITELTIIGGTYIACDPHQALSSMAVVNELGTPTMFSMFSSITEISIQGGEFTTVYADDPRTFASIIEGHYKDQEHHFAVFQQVTSLTIIGGTFISVRSTNISHGFPSSITATPDFQLFNYITTIEIVGATFTAVFPPSMEKCTVEQLFPHSFFNFVTNVDSVSSRFLFIPLHKYLRRWNHAGADSVTINTDSNNKTKLSMKNVGNGDINIHIHEGKVSFSESSRSQPEREMRHEEQTNKPLFGQSSSKGSKTAGAKRREIKMMIASLLALITAEPPTQSPGPDDEDNQENSDPSSIPQPRHPEPTQQSSQRKDERSERADDGAVPVGSSHKSDIHISTPAGAHSPNDTPSEQIGDPSQKYERPADEEPHQTAPERLITIHPLVLPPNGKPTVTAHQLGSLYFAAALHSADIPDFKAEYIYHGGKCTSIILVLNSAYDAEQLKASWDETKRGDSRVTSLASVSLYRGNVTARILKQPERDATLEVLASYSEPIAGSFSCQTDK